MRKVLALLCAFNAIIWIIAGASEKQPLWAICGSMYTCTLAIILAIDSKRKDGNADG